MDPKGCKEECEQERGRQKNATKCVSTIAEAQSLPEFHDGPSFVILSVGFGDAASFAVFLR
jgi:hypothetical protein